jgi:hypothetical protein
MIEFRPVTPSAGRPPQTRAFSEAQIAGLIAQSGCLVIVVVLAAIAAGIALDRWLNTRPAFTLILVLGSAPLTMFGLYRFAMRTLSKIPPPAVPGKKSDVDEDES